jgi:hypothetical protein
VITIALSIVLIVLFAFLIRNPLLSCSSGAAETAQNLITQNPQQFIDNPDSLWKLPDIHVRILVSTPPAS